LRSDGVASGIDFGRLALEFRAAVKFDHIERLARSLGLSVHSLRALGIGWSAQHGAWSFPMADADGAVRGIRLRLPNGRKLAIKGSKEGLFIPAQGRKGTEGTIFDDHRLLICEGATDTAGLLDLGFTNAVGRPSCTGGINIVIGLVKRRKPNVAVIVADGDKPGQRGANDLASVLLAYVATLTVIAPPPGIKDVRQWLLAGGTKGDLEHTIQTAKSWQLSIRGAR